VSGCARIPNELRLSRWQLSTSDGQTVGVALPSSLPLPELREGETFELRCSVRLTAALSRGTPTLYIPSYPSLVALSVDGRTIPVRGVAWRSTYARRQPHAFELPESAVSDGRIDLRLTVTHAWPLDRELASVPRIVPEGTIDRESFWLALLHIVVSLFALGGIAVVATGATVVAISRRSRRDYAYLAVAAVFVAPFVASAAGLSQSLGFGLGEFIAAGMSLSISLTALIWFVSVFFGLPRPSRAWIVLGAMPGIVFAASLDPFSSCTRVARVSAVFVTSALVHLVIQAARLRREGREGATVLLGCIGMVAAFAAPDILFYTGGPDLTGGVRVGIFAVLAYVWVLAFLVVRGEETSIAGAMTELEATVAFLEARREQTRAANEELRVALIARSARLYSGLAAAARPASPPPLEVGSELDGSYVVGLVRSGRRPFRSYEATRVGSGERCWLTPLSGASGRSFAGLIEDLRAVIHVNDPHIGRVTRVDIAPAGFVYVDAERVAGVALADFVGSRPTVVERLSILAQGAQGLATLHSESLCHRAVSAHTLFVHRHRKTVRAVWVDVTLSPRFRLGGPTDQVARADSVRPQAPSIGAGTEVDPTRESSPSLEASEDASTSPPCDGEEELDTEATFESFDTDGLNVSSLDTVTERTLPGGPRATNALAPELRTRSNRFTPAADVFAFGRLATNLLSDVIEKDEASRATFDSPGLRAALDSLRAALDHDPSQRPDSAELARALERATREDERVLRDAAGTG